MILLIPLVLFFSNSWVTLKADDPMSPPVVISKQQEYIVGAGSNLSLPCSAHGSPPLTFVWFQDDRNLTTAHANHSEPPSSTKLLEEKRYEIAEEYGPGNITTSQLYLIDLKITDTSVFVCWVENAIGYTIVNYSLIVNDSPPRHIVEGSKWIVVDDHPGAAGSFWRSIGLDRAETQAGTIGLLFLLILLAAIAVLILVLKQKNYANSTKGSQSGNITKKQHGKGSAFESLSAASKLGGVARRRPDSDDDYEENDRETDDDEDNRSSGSGSDSSCRKKPTVMAASDLDGFIEHMRSGIINMDYHTMSPVIQFNNNSQMNSTKPSFVNTNNKQHQVMNMSHFPSASNASSTMQPYISGGGSNSMATTMSDLSPSSEGGSQINFTTTNHQFGAAHLARQNQDYQYQPHQLAPLTNQPHQLTNCDHQQEFVPPMATNTTTTSYTSDYHSGYSEQDATHQIPIGTMAVGRPPMYYAAAAASGAFRQESLNQNLAQNIHSRPGSMLLQPHQTQHFYQTQQLGSTNNLVINDFVLAQQHYQHQQVVAPEANQRPSSQRVIRTDSGIQIL